MQLCKGIAVGLKNVLNCLKFKTKLSWANLMRAQRSTRIFVSRKMLTPRVNTLLPSHPGETKSAGNVPITQGVVTHTVLYPTFQMFLNKAKTRRIEPHILYCSLGPKVQQILNTDWILIMGVKPSALYWIDPGIFIYLTRRKRRLCNSHPSRMTTVI